MTTTSIISRKRAHTEIDPPENPVTPSELTDNKTRRVALPVVAETPPSTPRNPRNYSSTTAAALPVAPSQSPLTSNRSASSIQEFSTPDTKKNTAVPPGPRKLNNKIESDEEFAKRCYGEKPVNVGFSPEIQETVKFLRPNLPNSSTPEYYKLPSGRHVLAIQQPDPKTSSCGPGCALMIAADRQKVESAFGDQVFRQWYAKTEITDAKNIQRAFQRLQISCKLFRFTTDKDYALSEEDVGQYNLKRGKNSKDAIEFMKNTIDRTKCSLITAITHPKLYGHWVIIDEFDKGKVYGRCPRFGIAFCVPEATLGKWLFDREEKIQSMITFPS